MFRFIPRSALIGLAFIGTACGNGLEDKKAPKKDIPVASHVSVTKMTVERMASIIKGLDKSLEESRNRIVFMVRERELMVVYDEAADRMRIVTPIVQTAAVPEEVHARMLQANFDAVLDSRYAIANEIIWSVFIHRLSSLTEDDLKSAIVQTYFGAETFGSTYTSGAIVFGGGDTNSLHEQLLKEFENRPAKEDQGI